MPQVRLILALHNHQPVGNFESVFEDAFRASYRPFLDVLEDYPEIPFVLHTSGPLLEWLVDHHPEYLARLCALVEAGRVEILGGGFYEPILTMIPHRDRIGQIRAFSSYLQELFPTRVRGIWLAERVWEQHLVTAIVEAGIEYTVLDDLHFERSLASVDDLLGYFLTEDQGRLLKVFPAAETLRYTIPFQEPHATYVFLKRLAERSPGSTVVFADDGEKFGSWPKTFDHVYTNGWLRRFCDMIMANRDWLETTTFARAVDLTLPRGKVYLPDGSYREMMEWTLPPEALRAFQSVGERLALLGEVDELKRFFRPGGYWRNFKARYPETDEMYARMLGVSERLAAAGEKGDPDYLEVAQTELYRAQCNCAYWHGSFGGLYLPHLRNAAYRSLIAADNALDDALGQTGPRVCLEVGDFNLDARQEVRLENDRLIALIRPAQGGHVYELDVRCSATNVLATLNRRPELYHAAVIEAAERQTDARNRSHDADAAYAGDSVILKQPGLDRRLVYDRHPRKALVDHFYPIDVTLDDLIACREIERGDFAGGTYLSKVQRQPDRVSLVMERPGRALGHLIRLRKTIELRAGLPALTVHYEFEDLPRDDCLHFAVEINLAGMAGHAPDRYYVGCSGANLGPLDARVDLLHTRGLSLTDLWLDLEVGLTWSQAAGLWCHPIETVSHSDGGFEGVYQSSAVIPHWHVTADDRGRWDVTIRWSLDRASALTATRREHERVAAVEVS